MSNRMTISSSTLRRSLIALAVAVLTMVGTTGRAEAAGARGVRLDASPAAMSPCPQPGQRVKGSSSKIYLVDPQGYYDLIPDEQVYFNLWGSWSGLITLDNVTFANCEKAPLPMTGAYLLGDIYTNKIYIYDGTVGAYRWITSIGIFNKYKFDMSKVVWQSGAPGLTYYLDWNN